MSDRERRMRACTSINELDRVWNTIPDREQTRDEFFEYRSHREWLGTVNDAIERLRRCACRNELIDVYASFSRHLRDNDRLSDAYALRTAYFRRRASSAPIIPPTRSASGGWTLSGPIDSQRRFVATHRFEGDAWVEAVDEEKRDDADSVRCVTQF
jgi:hypothetical protein